MDKMKQWALLTAVAILAIAVGGWFLLISPQRSHASDLRTKTQTQQRNNDQLRNQLASLQSQHKGLPEVQAELAKLGVQLPSNPSLPALIRSLSSAADAAGVDLVSLSPAVPVAVTAAPTAPKKSAATSQAAAAASATASTATAASAAQPVQTSAGALQSITMAIVVDGGYFQVEQFVSNLEALTRPFLTTGIAMTPQAPSAPTASATATAPAPGTATTGSDTGGYDGHVAATITGQVFMLSGTTAAPTATK